MASVDLDPQFVRGLRLLHSKSKDAEDQLRFLLDDAIKLRHGNTKTLANVFVKKEATSNRESRSKSPSVAVSRKDGDRKSFKTSSDDSKDPPTKRLKPSKASLHSTSSSSSASTSPLPQGIINIRDESVADDTPDDDDDDADDGDDDLALDILEEDLTCRICGRMVGGARNQLVECVDCHTLFHQECHKPPIADSDINDPRSAWYCATCTVKNQLFGSLKRPD